VILRGEVNLTPQQGKEKVKIEMDFRIFLPEKKKKAKGHPLQLIFADFICTY
jgi:hypothetical protein